MTCCADDIRFAGLVCDWPDAATLQSKQWVVLEASICIREHPCYGRVGPVLTAVAVAQTTAPDNEVATFY